MKRAGSEAEIMQGPGRQRSKIDSGMSSDVFIISAARDANASTAIRQAVEAASVSASQIQDALFGLDGSSAMPDTAAVLQAAGLQCPAVCVSSSLRGVFFAAASILSEDVELSLVIGLGSGASVAFVLASPEAVGRLNLLPRARLAARSLNRAEAAWRAAEVTPADINIQKSGPHAAELLFELLEELDANAARWGMLSSSGALMLVERL
jgi:hypothetical protein